MAKGLQFCRPFFKFIFQKGGRAMEQWWTWISDVGFPVAVTFYLLTRMEQKLDKIIFALQHQQSWANSLDVMQKRQVK